MSDLHNDVVEDMAQDLRDSIAFGDTLETFFQDDGTPHAWLSSSADAEYFRRTNIRPEPGAVAAALYEILEPEYR